MAANQALINSAYQAALGGTQAKGFGNKQWKENQSIYLVIKEKELK